VGYRETDPRYRAGCGPYHAREGVEARRPRGRNEDGVRPGACRHPHRPVVPIRYAVCGGGLGRPVAEHLEYLEMEHGGGVRDVLAEDEHRVAAAYILQGRDAGRPLSQDVDGPGGEGVLPAGDARVEPVGSHERPKGEVGLAGGPGRADADDPPAGSRDAAYIGQGVFGRNGRGRIARAKRGWRTLSAVDEFVAEPPPVA
jgi:hypothetical protein